MFDSQNGKSYSGAVEKNPFKTYIETIDPEPTKKYRETLQLAFDQEQVVKKFETKLLELQKAMDDVRNEMQPEVKDLLEKIDNHEKATAAVHDIICKQLAVAEYNEFRNKIHVEEDGKVYMLDKEDFSGIKF